MTNIALECNKGVLYDIILCLSTLKQIKETFNDVNFHADSLDNAGSQHPERPSDPLTLPYKAVALRNVGRSQNV